MVPKVDYPGGGLQRGSQGESELNDSVKVLVVDEDQLVQAMVRRLFKTVVLIPRLLHLVRKQLFSLRMKIPGFGRW